MYVPADGWLPLGKAGELWSDLADHPARPWLDANESTLGTFALTRTLLQDVVHAAGGVEQSVGRVLHTLDASQRNVDEMAAANPEWDPATNAPLHFTLEPSLGWDYANLLTWVRSVEERIDRPGRRDEPRRLGLLPALADAEVRDEVARLLAEFKKAVGGERELANYALHASQLPSPGTPTGRIDDNGLLRFPIPDPSTKAVYIFGQFTYAQDRDLRTFAAQVLDETTKLVEGILAAFERANARIRAARGE
jgi:hypothetical protein